MHEGMHHTRNICYTDTEHTTGHLTEVANQVARVAGGESNRVDVDVGLHQ